MLKINKGNIRTLILGLFFIIFSYNLYSQETILDAEYKGPRRMMFDYIFLTMTQPYEYLTEALKTKNIDSLLNEIYDFLEQTEILDSIFSFSQLMDIQYDSTISWLYIKNKMRTFLSNDVKIKYYSIENGYYWVHDNKIKSNSENIANGFIVKNFLSNKRKVTLWLWLIYLSRIDYQFIPERYNLLLNNKITDCDFFIKDSVLFCNVDEKNLTLDEYLLQICKKKIPNDSNNCYQCMKPIFFKTEFNKKEMSVFYQHHMNWIKLVKEKGLDEVRRLKISPLPDGYSWELVKDRKNDTEKK